MALAKVNNSESLIFQKTLANIDFVCPSTVAAKPLVIRLAVTPPKGAVIPHDLSTRNYIIEESIFGEIPSSPSERSSSADNKDVMRGGGGRGMKGAAAADCYCSRLPRSLARAKKARVGEVFPGEN